MKEIHFFECYGTMAMYALNLESEEKTDFFVCMSYYGTTMAIDKNTPIILTTDMSSMSMDLIDQGYRIFLHQVGCEDIEIKVGDNDWTDKDIRMAHNIEKMWKSGAMRL